MQKGKVVELIERRNGTYVNLKSAHTFTKSTAKTIWIETIYYLQLRHMFFIYELI